MNRGKPSRGATACGQCSRAKVRCMTTGATSGKGTNRACDRCTRLNKPCTPQKTAPRVAPLPRTRFGELEQKVDDILESLSKQTPIMSPSLQLQSPRHLSNPPPQANRSTRLSRSNVSVAKPAPDTSRRRPVPFGKPQTVINDTLWPSDQEAELLLDLYEAKMGTAFPFVLVPDLPIAAFREERPYLFKALMMAGSYRDRELQKQRTLDFVASITKTVFLDCNRDLDILQALLIHIAWYQCHAQRGSQMTTLLQLAIAVLADLELNRPTHANDRRKLAFDGQRSSYGFTAEGRSLNNEERRAFLACYYLSSTGSTVYRKLDAMPYTSHLDNQLQALLNDNDGPGDILISELVRLQRLVRDITNIVPYDEPDRPRTFGEPFLMHLRAASSSLDNYQDSLPEPLQRHDLLLMHLHTARIFLYELSLYDSPWADTSSGSRLEALMTCSRKLKDFFQALFKFPGEAFILLPYSLWAQLSHALLVTSRLCLLKYPGWDPAFLDNDMHFDAIVEQTVKRVGQANQYAKDEWLGDTGDIIMERVTMKLGWMKSWFREYTSHLMDRANTEEYSSGESTMVNEIGLDWNLLDDNFWGDMMIESEQGPAI